MTMIALAVAAGVAALVVILVAVAALGNAARTAQTRTAAEAANSDAARLGRTTQSHDGVMGTMLSKAGQVHRGFGHATTNSVMASFDAGPSYGVLVPTYPVVGPAAPASPQPPAQPQAPPAGGPPQAPQGAPAGGGAAGPQGAPGPAGAPGAAGAADGGHAPQPPTDGGEAEPRGGIAAYGVDLANAFLGRGPRRRGHRPPAAPAPPAAPPAGGRGGN